MRLTKIICTLGPATHTPEMIRALAGKGMNIARLNFSHGSHEDHQKTIDAVKQVNAEDNRRIALLLDTKGAEIRTGDRESPIAITKNQEVVFSSHALPGETRPVIIVNYESFAKDVVHATSILLDNGVMSFEMIARNADGSVVARSHDDGHIGSRRHVNLPGADISLPSMMEKDWSDLEFGIAQGVDYVALSFIRTAEEVEEVAAFIKKHGGTVKTIAKIETAQAVANIDRIIAVSDGIMVARGDLGAELPYQKIPAIQDMIVSKCRAAGKPVIVATQMLESMIENPMPTRAEVTDIAHAVTTRADMTMLSAETAVGKHPAESVEAMSSILLETEQSQGPAEMPAGSHATGEHAALADAAVSMAFSVKSPAILVLTRTGKTPIAVSRLRSNLPIIALTESPGIQRMLQAYHGVTALLIVFDADPEVTITHAFSAAKEQGLLISGEKIVLISDTRAGKGTVHTVHVRKVP